MSVVIKNALCDCAPPSVAMVTRYFCKTLAERTTSTILKQLKSHLVFMTALGYRCARHTLFVFRTKHFHGNCTRIKRCPGKHIFLH